MWLHYENKLLYLVNITEAAGSLKIRKMYKVLMEQIFLLTWPKYEGARPRGCKCKFPLVCFKGTVRAPL